MTGQKIPACEAPHARLYPRHQYWKTAGGALWLELAMPMAILALRVRKAVAGSSGDFGLIFIETETTLKIERPRRSSRPGPLPAEANSLGAAKRCEHS